MMTAKRIQRKRSKGWLMPAGAIYVGRPSMFGNIYAVVPWPWGQGWGVKDVEESDVDGPYGAHVEAAQAAQDLFALLLSCGATDPRSYARRLTDSAAAELAGRDLACWCPLEDPSGNRFPCHADVLLRLANPEQSDVTTPLLYPSPSQTRRGTNTAEMHAYLQQHPLAPHRSHVAQKTVAWSSLGPSTRSSPGPAPR